MMKKTRLVVLMNALVWGGALAAGDTIPVAETLEFGFERPQDRSFAYGSAYIIEPADNEFPEPGFTVTFARMNTITANSFRAGLRVGAAYKCDWTYSGVFINSTDRYSKLYQFPYAELQAFETPTAGAAQVKPVLTFRAKQAAVPVHREAHCARRPEIRRIHPIRLVRHVQDVSDG